MIKPFTCVCMLLAAGSGLYLYQTKHRSQMLDREIGRTLKQIDATRDRIGVLKGEWALLNEPERLRELNGQHLGLQHLAPTQFTTVTELGNRLPAPIPGVRAPLPDDAAAAPPAPAEVPVAARPTANRVAGRTPAAVPASPAPAPAAVAFAAAPPPVPPAVQPAAPAALPVQLAALPVPPAPRPRPAPLAVPVPAVATAAALPLPAPLPAPVPPRVSPPVMAAAAMPIVVPPAPPPGVPRVQTLAARAPASASAIGDSVLRTGRLQAAAPIAPPTLQPATYAASPQLAQGGGMVSGQAGAQVSALGGARATALPAPVPYGTVSR